MRLNYKDKDGKLTKTISDPDRYPYKVSVRLGKREIDTIKNVTEGNYVNASEVIRGLIGLLELDNKELLKLIINEEKKEKELFKTNDKDTK